MFTARVIQWSGSWQSNARCLADYHCQEVCILLLMQVLLENLILFWSALLLLQHIDGMQVYGLYKPICKPIRIFLSVISYVINHTENYISTLRFVKDFTNFLVSSINQHHACLEYISLANLTIQNTTKNREVSKNSCRITRNKCVNQYTDTHYTSFIRDVLLGMPISQSPYASPTEGTG